jgi:hypothetical protein
MSTVYLHPRSIDRYGVTALNAALREVGHEVSFAPGRWLVVTPIRATTWVDWLRFAVTKEAR